MTPTSTAHDISHNTKIRWETLQFVVKRCIITVVGCLPTKGGCVDNNGGLHLSQGGVNRTGTLHLQGERDVTRLGNARLSRGQRVAHSSERVPGMAKKETETESVFTASGKLNSSSVASQLEAYRLKPEGATNCDFELPCVHYTRERYNPQQGAAIRYSGLWVADREVNPHE